jgi:hypothetical protein
MKLPRHSISTAALCLTSLALVPHARGADLTLPRDGWITWEVAAVDGAPDWCCYASNSWSSSEGFRNTPVTPCRLDGRQQSVGNVDGATTENFRIYVRTVGGKIDRLRAFSATCPVNAATGIRDFGTLAADDNARWLIDIARQQNPGAREHGETNLEEDVLAALAISRGDVARDGLANIARNDANVETRKQAVFWLARLRGSEGADITASIMFNDQSADVREHAAFALSDSRSPRAAADLIRLGNTDPDSNVRSQAWFWLAHNGAPEAENAIFAAIRKDADDEVREQAVFALSRLPNERATQALIAVVEDRSQSRESRKHAIFWLAQSESDSAQAYLEQVLTRN